jgi:hypothetical protein
LHHQLQGFYPARISGADYYDNTQPSLPRISARVAKFFIGVIVMTKHYRNIPYQMSGTELTDDAQLVSEHVKQRIYLIGCGEVVGRSTVFGEAVLAATSALEQLYVLDRTLAYLIAFGEIELEFAGVNDEGEPLYRRPDV